MSGHSKWSTIKRKKGAIDAARSKVFQKLAKELYVAAKSGDPDPNNNASLRMVVEKAKGENMPKANIESAIAKAANKSGGENYDSIRYEGYGPGGIAIIIDCLTDNKNRTAGFVRSTLTKRNGTITNVELDDLVKNINYLIKNCVNYLTQFLFFFNWKIYSHRFAHQIFL